MSNEEIFYRKEGRKYVPVKKFDHRLLDAYKFGTHLVVSRLNESSTIYNIDPEFAPMIAAGKYAHNDIANVIVRKSELKPGTVLTETQQKAWEEFAKTMGDKICYIEYPSAFDSVTAGLEAMQREANYMLQKPIVKKAYDHFMAIWKLTKDEQ